MQASTNPPLPEKRLSSSRIRTSIPLQKARRPEPGARAVDIEDSISRIMEIVARVSGVAAASCNCNNSRSASAPASPPVSDR